MKRFIFALLAAIILIVFAGTASYSDFGDGAGDADYGDYGGDVGGDYGGDYGGGYDVGDDYDDGGDYGGFDIDWDTDGSTDVSILEIIILLGIILLLCVIGIVLNFIIRQRTPKSKSKTYEPQRLTVEEYKKIDSGFSKKRMCEKLSDLFVQLQSCMAAKDMSPMRPYLTDSLYSKYEAMLEQKKEQGVSRYTEQVCVDSVIVSGFMQDTNNDHMYVTITSRFVDYTLNDQTGEIVSGSKDKEKSATFEWELIRPIGRASWMIRHISCISQSISE